MSKFLFQDRVISASWLLLAIASSIQIFAISGIFWSRNYFGSSFDPKIFSEFAEKQSDESVSRVFGLEEAKTARMTTSTPLSEETLQVMKKADQERQVEQVRQSEAELVKTESEKTADEIVSQAEILWKNGSTGPAIEQLQMALKLAPDYLPVNLKLAALYEEHHDFTKARFQWEKAAGMASPQSSDMREIQQNLDRLNELYTETKRFQETMRTPALRLEMPTLKSGMEEMRKVSIFEVTRKDLSLEGMYDLRFDLHVHLTARPSDPSMDIRQTKVEAIFYDQSLTAEGTLIPIKILTIPLYPKQSWMTHKEQTVSLNYSIPRGYFHRRIQDFGSSYAFCGFVIRAYYQEKIQDTYSSPPDILEKYARAGVNYDGGKL